MSDYEVMRSKCDGVSTWWGPFNLARATSDGYNDQSDFVGPRSCYAQPCTSRDMSPYPDSLMVQPAAATICFHYQARKYPLDKMWR
jgi:hypothetical protein